VQKVVTNIKNEKKLTNPKRVTPPIFKCNTSVAFLLFKQISTFKIILEFTIGPKVFPKINLAKIFPF